MSFTIFEFCVKTSQGWRLHVYVVRPYIHTGQWLYIEMDGSECQRLLLIIISKRSLWHHYCSDLHFTLLCRSRRLWVYISCTQPLRATILVYDIRCSYDIICNYCCIICLFSRSCLMCIWPAEGSSPVGTWTLQRSSWAEGTVWQWRAHSRPGTRCLSSPGLLESENRREHYLIYITSLCPAETVS